MGKALFAGKIVVIGCGSVSQCVLPILLKETGVAPGRITVVDFVDNRHRIEPVLALGVTYLQRRITPENYTSILGELLTAGDLLIDLGWSIDTVQLIEWCHDHGVLFVNTSVEVWDPYHGGERRDPRQYTLYARQMELQKMVSRWGRNDGPTAIVDHGANPGLVSHFTKHALKEICETIYTTRPDDSRAAAIAQALDRRDFSAMARLANVQVIHISERDTQVASVPKRVNEFVNTWSVEGLYEEGVAPAEMGWGTHEKILPQGGWEFEHGPKNAIQRILNDEIVDGWDELGVLLMGHDFNAWWTGTVLDIHKARELVPNQNATTVQVAISVVGAAMWMFKNPRRGFCLPDDIDERDVLQTSMSYLGDFVSRQVTWHPVRDLDLSLTAYGTPAPHEQDAWQFGTFCLGAGVLRSA